MPRTKSKGRAEYTFVKIPKDLVNEVDNSIDATGYGYRSRSEFIKDAVRRLLSEYHRKEELLPSIEHFNLNEEGVLVLDRTLQPERIVQIFFKPEGPWCEHCESMKCRHVEFALDIPKVQDILQKKGWKMK
jgi:Arc/MetJ-type ribon-helix-helix transcriptional regulator